MNIPAFALAIGAALFLFSKRSSAASLIEPLEFDTEFYVPDVFEFTERLDDMSDVASPVPPEVRAMLHLIRHAEHSALTPEPLKYQTFFGGQTFFDLSDHPVNTGELTGVRLSPEMCRNAGFSAGCVSTAAGAYQIIRPTWNRIRNAGRYGPRLPDFSAASQDEAAVRLLKENGAFDLLLTGDIDGAILRAGRLWASLPGSTARQNPKTLEYARGVFAEGLQV